MSAGVAEGLAAAAALFASAGWSSSDELVYGPLVARVQGAPSPELELAVELIYEGYLAHYRTSRLVPGAAGLQVLLLAGDYFYAHGLRSIAAGGDVDAVGLLTRLMGACALLRVEQQPLRIDDCLWEMAVSAVAAGEGSAARVAARAAFSTVEMAGRRQDWAAVAAAAGDGMQAVRNALARRPAHNGASPAHSGSHVAEGA